MQSLVKSTSRVIAYQNLKKEQKWAEALEMIRREVASPFLHDAEYLASIRIILIGALGDYADSIKLEPGMDDEAERAYREGLGYAFADANLAGGLRTTFARYYSDSMRNGLAIPLYRDNLAFWRAHGDTFQIFMSLDALASGYNDMGETALRDHYREEALVIAAGYFGKGSGPSDAHEWLQYKQVLNKRMDNIAYRGRAAEVEKLWVIVRDITERFLSPESLSYMKAAELFAFAGENDRAEHLLAQARSVYDGESGTLAANLRTLIEADFAVSEGTVALMAGRYAQAVERLEKCSAIRTRTGVATQDMALGRLMGLAYEGVGDADKAAMAYRDSIRLAEGVRASYTVAERAAFFRSAVKRSYHGLIRISARQAATGGIAKFWEAVQASELVRARQLGDIIDPKAPPTLGADALEGLRAALGPEQAVLYFTVTERDLVLLAFTRDRYQAVLQPIDGAAFEHQVRDIAHALGRPESNLVQLEHNLLALSRTVLGPLAELLQDKSELVVLPDGVLNLVPFDLLSADLQAWRPLVQTHRVRLVPSLRFVSQKFKGDVPPAGGLLVVADPAYRSKISVAGLNRGELQAITRGSSFLKYFTPLPETRTEAQSIAGLFKSGRVDMLLGAQAAESVLKKQALGSYGYLHFATHGILGGEVPGVGEPALVLANEAGEDGFLTASEVSALKLGARLAVLSACNTGSGEYVTGEGVMGMSRAFLLAGSQAVVVSLWPVASEATERLMVCFYKNLTAGQDAQSALRTARLTMLEEAKRTGSVESHPFFWAPFVLFGD